MTATAADNVGVVGVQFQLDGASLGAEDLAAPYSVDWSSVASANGAHTLTAVARDAAGNRTTSSPVVVTVANGGPVQEDKALNRVASASSVDEVGHEAGKGNDGSSTTRWSSAYLNNQWWQVDLGSARSVDTVRLNWEVAYASQYRVQTSTDGVSFSVAATDGATAAGWRSTSFTARTARYVRVLGVTRATRYGISFWDAQVFGPADGSVDTTPPTVSLTAPAGGATVSGTVPVAASAADNVGVVGVQFQLDGASLGAEDLAAPYSVDWASATSSNGAHTLTAVARDAAGNRTTSGPVAVTVSNGAPTNAPPVPTISSPASTLTWSVGDVVAFSGSAVRCGGRRPVRRVAPVEADHASLSVELSHARARELQRLERIVYGSGPRVSVAPRVAADGDRLGRGNRGRERAPEPATHNKRQGASVQSRGAQRVAKAPRNAEYLILFLG